MQDLTLMERFEAFCHMDESPPDLFLLILGPGLLMLLVLFEDIAPSSNLHDNIKGRRWLVIESLLVANYILLVVGC